MKKVSKKSDVIKKDTGKRCGNSKQKNIDSKKTLQKNMKVSETDKVLDEKLMVENNIRKIVTEINIRRYILFFRRLR